MDALALIGLCIGFWVAYLYDKIRKPKSGGYSKHILLDALNKLTEENKHD